MKDKYPKISVLMPVYNAEKFLKEAIDSILNQTFKDFEFLIINDASNDNSKKIILSYKNLRIRYFENDNNLGVTGTLNKGLRLARAELIARMDADDISLPNRFELQYKEMKKDKEIAVLASTYDVVDEGGTFLYTEKYNILPEEIYYTLQFRNCLGHPTIIFRKRIILNIFNGYNQNHEAEDYDLWLRLSSKYKISKLNICLLHLRASKNSRTGATSKIPNDVIFLVQKNLESLTGKKINFDTIDILRKNFAAIRFSSSTKYSKKEIKRAIVILRKVNHEILTYSPMFLNKSVLNQLSIKKLNSLKYDLSLARLFDLKFGFILKFLFRVYFFFKIRFILGFYQLRHYFVANILRV